MAKENPRSWHSMDPASFIIKNPILEGRAAEKNLLLKLYTEFGFQVIYMPSCEEFLPMLFMKQRKGQFKACFSKTEGVRIKYKNYLPH